MNDENVVGGKLLENACKLAATTTRNGSYTGKMI